MLGHSVLNSIRMMLAVSLLLVSSVVAAGENQTSAKTLRRYTTLNSIGVEWDIEGDADHDASCRVEYRQSGRAKWSPAMDLLRIDYHGYYDTTKADRRYNMLAGSIFFLLPGASYQVRLTLEDPDGGGRVEQFEVKTWARLVIPTDTRRLHVVPG